MTTTTTTKPKPAPTVEELTIAFRAAKAAALEAATNPEDDGTCNLDTAVLRLSHRYKKRVEEAASAAGVEARPTHWIGACYFVIVPRILYGQANRRTRIAVAAGNALKAAGLEACVYYQMD